MQTEVTNEQYGQCVASGDCRESDSDVWKDSGFAAHPVTDVSWDDAVSYATWLSGESSQIVRLPTEAEWEKTARGTDGRIYPWGNDERSSDLANYGLNVGSTAPVGSYPDGAGPYGTLDMAGNAWEWTSDWYESTYYTDGPVRNPTGPDLGDDRVVHGGAWYSNPNNVRAAHRYRSNPVLRFNSLGVRLVVSSPGS